MNAWIASRSAIAIAAWLTLLAVPAKAQIVALGASNTAGRGVGASEAFPAQLEAMLQAKGRSMHVTNASISGDTTGGMLARLSSVPAGTTIVILQAGGNDLRRGGTVNDRQANIAQIKKQLASRGIRCIEADGFVGAALQAGLRQPDGQHLTVEGHRRVAAALLRLIH